MSEILREYFLALERLKNGKPNKVPKGIKITKDSVSLEAGRKKGSIKRSRPIFNSLIEAIDAAAKVKATPGDEMRYRLDEAKAEAVCYRVRWEEALAREVSLVKQLWDERKEWAKERAALTGGKVSTLRRDLT